MTESALVLDAAQRSALAVTRSLGRAGLRVATAEAAPEALAAASRYSRRYFVSPSPEHEPDAYIEWLAGLLADYEFDAVVPVTEVTSQLLLSARQRLPGLSVPFADYETVMALADKGRLMELAAEQGVPHPDSRWYANASELDPATISYPVVLKPALSKIRTAAGWVATHVRLLRNAEDLKRELAESDYLHRYPFMLQAFVPGAGAGVFCLYNRGEPVAYFAHRRLREKPPEGGVSVLSESAPVDRLMRDYADRLLRHVGWHGVAMVEFRVTPDGRPYLMEVNTRFWGSLQLAVDAGVDFPHLLWKVHRGRRPEGPTHYRLGQRLRWWLGDLDSLYLYWRGDYTIGQKLRRLLAFVTPRWRGQRHEVNRWGDWRPGWFELKQYLRELMGRE